MIRLDAVRTRILSRVGALEGRLGNAADFGTVVDTGRIPTTTPAGFVMFGGLQGGVADAVSGMFRQSFTEGVTIVLMDRINGNPLADKALKDISPLVGDVIGAVCGWAPDDAIGVFELRGAELVGAKGGALVFQIDFSLNDQLRITT